MRRERDLFGKRVGDLLVIGVEDYLIDGDRRETVWRARAKRGQLVIGTARQLRAHSRRLRTAEW